MHFYNNMFFYTESDLVEHCILDMSEVVAAAKGNLHLTPFAVRTWPFESA